MKMKIAVLFVVIGMLLGVSVFAQEETVQSDQVEAAEGKDLAYKIQPGDILQINVYGSRYMHNPPFRLRVAADGIIAFPLLGRVEVGGLTEVEVIERLDGMLLDGYLKDPQVTLIVLEGGDGRYGSGWGRSAFGTGQKQFQEMYTVYGAVEQQGEYPISPGLTASQAIVRAEGFTDTASKNGVKVIRKMPDGKTKVIRVPVDSIFKTGKNSKDVLLQDGDRVVVPESWF